MEAGLATINFGLFVSEEAEGIPHRERLGCAALTPSLIWSSTLPAPNNSFIQQGLFRRSTGQQ